MPKINVGGLGMYYEEAGSGEPLVLIIGLGGDTTYWAQTQVPAFVAAGYRCISIDNRDAGQSDGSPCENYTTREMADDVAGVIAGIGVAPVHVLGWSMGGMIAQELALNHPALVRSLTLLATYAGHDAGVAAWTKTMTLLRSRCTLRDYVEGVCLWGFGARFLAQPGALDAAMDAGCAAGRRQSAEAYCRQARACITHAAASRLGDIRTATHVIVGEEDLITPVAGSRFLAEHIPGARLTVLPHVGHCAAWEDPAAFNDAVLAFTHDLVGAA